jgi:predicted SprT family Zn-dependent metalloprotease
MLLNDPSFNEPEESSPPPESPGFESPAQESLIVDATAGTLNESSFTETEPPVLSQLAKAKDQEVVHIIDSSSDEERESSTMIATYLKAWQPSALVTSSDDESSELLRERKNSIVARSASPTVRGDSSSSISSEDTLEWNDVVVIKSSFSKDNESVKEQSGKLASSDDEEKDDEDDDDSVDQLVQRTNRLVIDNDGDSSKAKRSVSKAAFLRSREAMGAETFVAFDTAAFGGRLGAAKVTLEWSNNLRTTAGMARLRKTRQPGCMPILTASIELSTKVVDDPHRLRTTLLHEMCHAAAWIIDGVSKPPHGKCFQKWARVAMNHVRDIEVITRHNFQISFKYVWTCVYYAQVWMRY